MSEQMRTQFGRSPSWNSKQAGSAFPLVGIGQAAFSPAAMQMGAQSVVMPIFTHEVFMSLHIPAAHDAP